MLCVSGLDVTIVGHYDYGQTAFYATAVLPTNFMLSIMGAALAPLLPTASALSVHRTPAEMGRLLARITRYSTVLLLFVGLPLLVGGYILLRLWVGPVYALHAVGYLRVLLLANIVRNLCLPYSSMLVATNRQRVAIFGAGAEAIVNLAASLYLVRHIGAIGVAYGTLIGSFVSVGMHFAVSMHYTRPTFCDNACSAFSFGHCAAAWHRFAHRAADLLLVARDGTPARLRALAGMGGLDAGDWMDDRPQRGGAKPPAAFCQSLVLANRKSHP